MDFIGVNFKLREEFMAMTVDQGGTMINAVTALGIDVIKCNVQRLNTVVVLTFGIATTLQTCRNSTMGELMKTLMELQSIQALKEAFTRINERVGHSDTR